MFYVICILFAFLAFLSSLGMGIFILGERLNLFMDPSARMKRFQKAGASFVEEFGSLFSGIPLYRLVPTPSSVRFVDAAHQLEEITKELVEEKIAKLSKSDNGDKLSSGFLEQWLMSEDFSKEDIAVLMRDFLAAGIDTVSALVVCSGSRVRLTASISAKCDPGGT